MLGKKLGYKQICALQIFCDLSPILAVLCQRIRENAGWLFRLEKSGVSPDLDSRRDTNHPQCPISTVAPPPTI
jgi:hypothetical protein